MKKLFKSEETILDEVKLREEEPKNNGFALMLEQDDGTYEESTSNSWPTNMVFNSELSGCIDIDGNIIEDSLSFDSTNNIMNVSVSETAYCYVYFDIATIENLCVGKEFGSCLIENNSIINNLNDNVEGGLYRYQGTNEVVNDNYICFGTTDKTTCTESPNTYMYRIIVIDESGQLKLIKNASIGNSMWHNTYSTNTTWPESDLYKGLNGIEGGYYTNLFVNNSTYDYMAKNSNWYNKIADTSWKYGSTSLSDNLSNGASAWYYVENGWTNTVSAKIGLIYLYDYYYAYQSGGTNCFSNYSGCKTSWMNSGSEWTMTRDSEDYGYYTALCVRYTGGVASCDLTGDGQIIRPVFFLTSNVEYTSGTGTSSDSFILSVN